MGAWFALSIDRFRQETRGNVAIIFAIVLLPMIGFIGLGVDVSRTISAKTNLDAAADAAALAASTEAMATLNSSYGQGSSGTATAQYAGQLAAQQVFTVNARRTSQWIGATPTPQVTVTVANQTITATVKYTANVPTLFGGMYGVKKKTVLGTAVSSLAMPKYLNISVVVDISQSMGLASTQAYMSQLSSLTGGCAFGCHVYQSGQSGTDPYEKQAHDHGIQLRIDVIQAATKNMIATAQNLQGSSGMISFGLYTLQGGVGQPFTTLAAPTTNYASLTTAANGIDLGPNNSGGVGDTDYPHGIPAINTAVGTSGDGSASTKPIQYVFLMTDGVMDTYQGSASTCTGSNATFMWNHCTGTIDPTQCSALKARGVTVGVIYTTYLAMPDRVEYQALVSPFANQIPPNLQSCASSGWYYEATDASDIQNAINSLFSRATGRGILTQ